MRWLCLVALLLVTQAAVAEDALPRRPEVFEVGGAAGDGLCGSATGRR